MKYYAVTEDPNELLHYGVKGMKWGQHIFGDKPKSPGYRSALGKLRSTTKKTSVPNAMKSNNQRSQYKYYKRAAKKDNNLLTKVSSFINEQKTYAQINNERRRQKRLDRELNKTARYEKKAQVELMRQQAKAMRNATKNEVHFEKIMKKARQGRLKYGKLTEEQVQRVQSRLLMEENARRLGSKERTWKQQKKDARREGKLLGITKGTAAAMEEVARAGTQYGINHLANRMKMREKARQEGKNERIKNRQKNKKTARQIRDEVNEAVIKERLENGERLSNVANRPFWQTSEYLKQKKLSEEQKRIRNIDNDLKNEVYKRIVLGGKGDSTDAIIKRLDDREKYYKKIFGESASKFDQPNTNGKSKMDILLEKAAKTRSRGRKVKETVSKAKDIITKQNARRDIINDIKDRTNPDNYNYFDDIYDEYYKRNRK